MYVSESELERLLNSEERSSREMLLVIDLGSQCYSDLIKSRIKKLKATNLFLIGRNSHPSLPRNFHYIPFFPMEPWQSYLYTLREARVWENRNKQTASENKLKLILGKSRGFRRVINSAFENFKLKEEELETTLDGIWKSYSSSLSNNCKNFLDSNRVLNDDSLLPGLSEGWADNIEGHLVPRLHPNSQVKAFQDLPSSLFFETHPTLSSEEFEVFEEFKNELYKTLPDQSLKQARFTLEEFLGKSKNPLLNLVLAIHTLGELELLKGNLEQASLFLKKSCNFLPDRGGARFKLELLLTILVCGDQNQAKAFIQSQLSGDNDTAISAIAACFHSLFLLNESAFKENLVELDSLQLNDPWCEHFIFFLGYLSEKIQSPTTYLRMKSLRKNMRKSVLNPVESTLLSLFDESFHLCINENGRQFVAHRFYLEELVERKQNFDFFFDYNNEQYYQRSIGSLKVEKSRITLLIFCLLTFFPGRHFSWRELFEAIYGKEYNPEMDEATIRMAVTRLKKQLNPADENYFGISITSQKLYLKSSTKFCVIVSDEEIEELQKLSLKLDTVPNE